MFNSSHLYYSITPKRSRNIYYALPPSSEASKYDVLENLWKKAGLKSVEIKKIYVERTFANFDEFWQVNGLSMAIKPIFEKLDDPSIEEEIKTSIQKKLEAKSSDGKILISGHVNAIKGIV